MAETLQILKWKSEGLRCPDHEISFSDSKDGVSPISLIQMPNGTGKTTTLELLRAALSGSAEDGGWDAEKIRSLRKKGTGNATGSFQLVLLQNGQQRITIVITFDFEEGVARYTTTVKSGIRQGFDPPVGLQKFLRPEFVPFFVFDGELAERLLSREHTNAQEAIEDLFQLKVFTHVVSAVQEYWTDQTQATGATEEKGLNRRRNRVDFLKNRLETLKKEQAKVLKKYENQEQELLKKKNKFNAALAQQKEIGERLRTAEADLSKTKSDVQNCAHEVLARMRDAHALSHVFAREMISLKANLDRVKLPESTAREFFEELAGETHCVCGRELNDETRNAIRSRAKQYLGSDDVALLNAIKGDIANLVGTDEVEHEKQVKSCIANLRQLVQEEGEKRTIRDQIQTEGIVDNPELEKAQQDIVALEKEVGQLRKQRDTYDDPSDAANDEQIFGIKILQRRLEDAERKLAEVTHTLELKEKRDVLVKILESAQAKARKGISQDVCTEANARIKSLMPSNAITVEKVERCLVLHGQEGGSVGETLSVAYAFLATLFNRSEHQLPFIVDSPANPIDLKIRGKVAELIPKLTNQFIAFTISSEREGFLPALETAAKQNIQFFTVFRKGAQSIEASTSKNNKVESSADGVLITGRPFFTKFHVEKEENDAGTVQAQKRST
jgi:DNA sulfur modification protein DndD